MEAFYIRYLQASNIIKCSLLFYGHLCLNVFKYRFKFNDLIRNPT